MKRLILFLFLAPLVFGLGACADQPDLDLGIDLYLEYLENADPGQLADLCEGARDVSADVADGVAEAEKALTEVKDGLAELDAKVADKCGLG